MNRSHPTRLQVISSIKGSVVWICLAAIPKGPEIPIGQIELMFLLAVLVGTPLALRLMGQLADNASNSVFLRFATYLQPVAAVLVAGSFFFSPGQTAGFIALPWFAVTALMGIQGALTVWQRHINSIGRIVQTAALLFIPVGGTWLLLSRFGVSPNGFHEPIVLLTAVHFHFTGFIAPLIADVVYERTESASPRTRSVAGGAALGLISGTPLLAAGFLLSPALKVIAAFLLALSLLILAVVQIKLGAGVQILFSKILFFVSGISVIAAMTLAAIYAVGEFRSELLISIPQMAKTHGVLNGLGFCICGLLGLILSPRENRL